ncbi:MAG: ribosome recycling factor [Cytophagales bacterium]|nr:MAG: ribosome recycling factor [Rhodothermaeota bacterium MED-G18]RPG06596.1 MAG: ribosome recycling factor [Pelagibacteraceae bacterium TMED267]|tara:strand:- start:474 stop:1034 length:561 start_codon:yes stop_codon:yes gene_type:complete
MEEIELILEDTKERMNKSIQFLISELKKIRAGKAMPNMLDGISVDYYGAPTPLIQVASITTPDTRTLFIKPWEKTIIQEIEKAIMNSDLGLSPQNDGENVFINIPPLTEERRILLAKQIKSEGEKGKISIRAVRKESNEFIKKLSSEGVSEDLIKDGEGEVQKITDMKINQIDEVVQNKEKEIKTI